MPHGFALDEPRFWANQAFPWIGLVAVALGLGAALRGRPLIPRAVALAACGACCGASLTAFVLFPVSAQRFGWASGALALWHVVSGFRVARSGPRAGLLLGAALLGAVPGGLFAIAQRGSDPGTRPANAPVPPAPTGEPLRTSVRLGAETTVFPARGTAAVDLGSLKISVDPFLRFVSRSPDRCWTVFAGQALRGPRLALVARADSPHAVELSYRADGRAWLRAEHTQRAIGFETRTELPAPIYSHLNSASALRLAAPQSQRFALSFSPCPTPVAVTPADYPVGRPARFGYLGADGQFRVVEARSGEKGPFTTLASGPLARDAPLTISVLVDEALACRIVLEDFAAQASTNTSPTAGWRVPENAIEFRLARSPHLVMDLWVELAATSVGRGWDSVGHAAGTYRNRLRIELP